MLLGEGRGEEGWYSIIVLFQCFLLIGGYTGICATCGCHCFHSASRDFRQGRLCDSLLASNYKGSAARSIEGGEFLCVCVCVCGCGCGCGWEKVRAANIEVGQRIVS